MVFLSQKNLFKSCPSLVWLRHLPGFGTTFLRTPAVSMQTLRDKLKDECSWDTSLHKSAWSRIKRIDWYAIWLTGRLNVSHLHTENLTSGRNTTRRYSKNGEYYAAASLNEVSLYKINVDWSELRLDLYPVRTWSFVGV